jgi:hypothetical protein
VPGMAGSDVSLPTDTRWPRDSNPRGSQPPYTLSRRVPSAARAGHRDESSDGTGSSSRGDVSACNEIGIGLIPLFLAEAA